MPKKLLPADRPVSWWSMQVALASRNGGDPERIALARCGLATARLERAIRKEMASQYPPDTKRLVKILKGGE